MRQYLLPVIAGTLLAASVCGQQRQEFSPVASLDLRSVFYQIVKPKPAEACGKRSLQQFLRRVSELNPTEREYFLKANAESTLVYDIDGDKNPERIKATSYPLLNPCNSSGSPVVNKNEVQIDWGNPEIPQYRKTWEGPFTHNFRIRRGESGKFTITADTRTFIPAGTKVTVSQAGQ